MVFKMAIKKTVIISSSVFLFLAGAADAQEWGYPRGYGPLSPGRYDDDYYEGGQTYWRQPNPDYRYYYPDDQGQYDPNADSWQDRPSTQQATREQDINLDPGVKDDTAAVMAKSPIPRAIVPYSGYAAGTIIISTKERRLYLMLDDGTAVRYGIGVGKQGFSWKGEETVSQKREWPDWTPPKEMIARRPELPDHMDGGLNNPLGARALYLGSTLYRIHGTNEPNSIGKAVSSGCIRMANPDIIDLYNRVDIGTHVVVL
jgi:lipoprotein-anchoring transpeptidase ErfK/SrfK